MKNPCREWIIHSLEEICLNLGAERGCGPALHVKRMEKGRRVSDDTSSTGATLSRTPIRRRRGARLGLPPRLALGLGAIVWAGRRICGDPRAIWGRSWV